MGKIAFIYPGQGAQKVGMGKDFYENYESANKIYEAANEALDIKITDICFNENELINQTEYTQPALVTTCLAITRVLIENGITPDVTAGLSLGEYAAIATAGGMSEKDAISTVYERGKYMAKAVPKGEGTMAAVLGMEALDILEVISKVKDVTIANYNCKGQIVITGKTKGVREALVMLKEAGAKRCVELNVSGPFHSPFLVEAGERLRNVIGQVHLNQLNIPYVTNVTANYVTDIKETCDLLVKQVSSPVKWYQSVEKMIENGVYTFIEIGPNKTLAGFMKKINKDVSVYNVETVEDLGEILCTIKK